MTVLNREKCLRFVFYMFSILKTVYSVTAASTEILCTNLVEIKPAYGYISFYVSMITMSIKLIVAATLFYLMKKYANYEYGRITRSLVGYLILDVVSYCLGSFLFTIELLGENNMKNCANIEYCNKLFRFLRIFFLTNVPQVLVAYAIIRLKDYNDPIQYISRFDNTQKVSIFQRWIDSSFSERTTESSVSSQQKRRQ